MAAQTPDNARCITFAAANDTVTGPVFVERVKWYGGAIAAGDTVEITGIAEQSADLTGLEGESTRGSIFGHTAGAADQPWLEYVNAVYRSILVDTWTGDNGTLKMWVRPTGESARKTEY